jgi:hypothetical protein
VADFQRDLWQTSERWLAGCVEMVGWVRGDGWLGAGRGKVKFREMGGLVQGDGWLSSGRGWLSLGRRVDKFKTYGKRAKFRVWAG